INSTVDERRCFCDLRSATIFARIGVIGRVCENTNFTMIAREFPDFAFLYFSLSLSLSLSLSPSLSLSLSCVSIDSPRSGSRF
ncbi:hypothetical protein WN51_08643, partial [Melipona quadrifasciata]